MSVDKLTQIEWLMNHHIPCIKCIMGSDCCGCPAHKKWKEKFNELGISDAVYDEAVAVRNVIDDLRKIQDLKAKVDKKLANISDEVKDKFIHNIN